MSVGVGLAAGFILAEIGLRLYVHWIGRPPVWELEKTTVSFPPLFDGDCARLGVNASLGQIVRPSDDPEIVYQLKENLDTCFVGVRVRTNGVGLRSNGRDLLGKPREVFRVLALGDSQTFGWGVSDEHTFPAILERELNRISPGPQVEVVNAGVPGYNTAQEAGFLRRYGGRLAPDCVIVLFVGNDFGLPYLYEVGDSPRPSGSYLFRALRSLWGRHRRVPVQWHAPDGEWSRWVSVEDLPRVPLAYRHMVGLDGYKRALRSLAATAETMGIPIVNFAEYDVVDEAVAEELIHYQRSLGFVHPEFRYPSKDRFRMSDSDPHFNGEGHENLALRMLNGLQQERVCLPK